MIYIMYVLSCRMLSQTFELCPLCPRSYVDMSKHRWWRRFLARHGLWSRAIARSCGQRWDLCLDHNDHNAISMQYATSHWQNQHDSWGSSLMDSNPIPPIPHDSILILELVHWFFRCVTLPPLWSPRCEISWAYLKQPTIKVHKTSETQNINYLEFLDKPCQE